MGLGTPEIILIALALLLIFGAKRIPEIARGLGKGMREFKDATKDIQRELTVDIDDRKTTYRPQPPPQAAPQPQAPPAQPPAEQPPAQPAQAAPAPDAAASGPTQAPDQPPQS
ncbi:MAG: twin-arginine translocase TatA/TatE family subunit [Bacteroidetes bacterium SB0662_bin_6]|nr:twin-arginine translocase TatA/TatE family subunit [Bacteroidetes bacterium SB0668_bin_1]MYE05210.1 twin-arginine translocase TatA/TatE family subunit [Bacteroidetes bacterium SB0662_bin_6]